jgi:hypothetical protein
MPDDPVKLKLDGKARNYNISQVDGELSSETSLQHRLRLRKEGVNYPPVYFMTIVATREDVKEFMSHHSGYTKANKFKDVVIKIFI